jgi:hypothetical protein
MNLAFDIDDTITAKPALFAALSIAAGVKKVIIVTSRGNSDESRRLTLEELANLGIRHHQFSKPPYNPNSAARFR